MDSKVVNQALEANPVNRIRWESGELGTSQSSVVYRFKELSKNIQSYRTVSHINDILQNFWLTLVSCVPPTHTIYIYIYICVWDPRETYDDSTQTYFLFTTSHQFLGHFCIFRRKGLVWFAFMAYQPLLVI